MTDPASSSSELDLLFTEARAHPPDTSRAEFAFETRLLARLPKPLTPASAWARINWQLIPAFTLMVLGLMIWETQVSNTASESQQNALVENPEAGELLTNFN